jgi:hypothetical protein
LRRYYGKEISGFTLFTSDTAFLPKSKEKAIPGGVIYHKK